MISSNSDEIDPLPKESKLTYWIVRRFMNVAKSVTEKEIQNSLFLTRCDTYWGPECTLPPVMDFLLLPIL